MRFSRGIGLCALVVTTVVFSASASAQAIDPDQSLRLYAVHIDPVPGHPWGTGVYLGNGLVITAAHVAGPAPLEAPRVEIGGKEVLATIIKKGELHKVDLALLTIDEAELPVSLRLRRMSVCKQPPWPGEEVIVAIPEGIARSHVVSPTRIPRNLDRKFRTAIADVATTGNSGSGVFDARKECLLGIISEKIFDTRITEKDGHKVQQTRDLAKYFVPASVIADFIPSEYHF
jgi:trypsin-like peptidase